MIVETKNGEIRGFENESMPGGRKYFSYLGIPFAKPPIGDLRFAPPEPVDNWNEVYDATYEREKCFQFDLDGGEFIGSDDCLHLNIHTPDINTKSLKPVLFFIHAGGFFSGSGNEAFHGADYLMNYDVVLVTINYRLHMLGFLNLEIPECPGNAGLKDQVMALKWVKENISAFGGDPNNITIDGCSAGGSSVNLLMISPLAKSLFQKAIMQCGTALSPWSLTHDPLKWAFEAAEMLGFNGDSRLELLNFFRSLSGREIANVANQLLGKITENHPARGLHCPFSPSVEVIKEGAFLPDYPINLMKTATPIPCIAGYNQVERIYLGKYISENISNASESMIKEIVRSNFKVNDSQLARIEAELRKVYFQQNDRNKSNMEKIDELLTDICCFHFYDALDFVSNSNTPLYVYHFTYYSEYQSPVRKMLSHLFPISKNAFHGEELCFLFSGKTLGGEPFQESSDISVQKNICQLWTNFMKTGNPSSDSVNTVWKPHSSKEPYYLQIDSDLELKNAKISEERMELLKKLFRGIEFIK